ncbi:MAG TPA: sulfite exporter TauE/SafE family protein [Ohtaekwangia sp.]|nr:sulfite exporter TauE/SafE family protein [Ohtaekwangia sp.]
MEIFGFMAIIGIGLVLGSVGAGGSMLTIPVLIHLFAMDMETASAYSLFLVGVTSLTGAALKQKEHLVSMRATFLFGIPSVAGAFISRNWIMPCIPHIVWKSDGVMFKKDDLLLALFLLLMLMSSIAMLIRLNSHAQRLHTKKTFVLIPLGLATGLIVGLSGTGGGFLVLPALIIFAALPLSTAVGTSLLIIASNCLLGFCGDILNRTINWDFLFLVTALAMSGLLVGYWWHNQIKRFLFAQQFFAWLMLAVSLLLLTLELVWR